MSSVKNKISFKGLWIPKEMFPCEMTEHKDLNWIAKMIFLDIHSFKMNGKNCFYSNAFLANKYGVSERQISKYISKLIKIGWIELVNFNGRNRYLDSLKDDDYTIEGRTKVQGRGAKSYKPIVNNDSDSDE